MFDFLSIYSKEIKLTVLYPKTIKLYYNKLLFIDLFTIRYLKKISIKKVYPIKNKLKAPQSGIFRSKENLTKRIRLLKIAILFKTTFCR